MGKIRIKFKQADGEWSGWMGITEVRQHSFVECVIEETMTREEYGQIYWDEAFTPDRHPHS